MKWWLHVATKHVIANANLISQPRRARSGLGPKRPSTTSGGAKPGRESARPAAEWRDKSRPHSSGQHQGQVPGILFGYDTFGCICRCDGTYKCIVSKRYYKVHTEVYYQLISISSNLSLDLSRSLSLFLVFVFFSLSLSPLSLSLSLPLCFSLLICHIILGQSAPAEPENLSIWLSAAGFQRPATWRTTRSGNREIHPSRTARRCLATMGLNGSKWAQEPQGGMIVISLNTEHDHKSIQFITNLWWPVDSTAALPKKVYCSRVSSLKMVPPVFCLSGPTQSLAPSLWVLWQWGENGGKGGSFLIPRLHGQENQYRNPHANEISHPDQAAQGWPRQMRRATRSRPRFVQRVLQPSRYWRRRCLSHKAHDRMTFGAQGLRQSENADSR